ncbi:2286_t:CDS:2, partial [Dentiscutata erythropus]
MARHRANLKQANVTKKKKRSWNCWEKLAIITYLEKNPSASKRNTTEKFGIEPKQLLKTKAQQLARQLHFISIYPNINEYKWSDKWLDGFMHRHKLSNHCRTTVAQKLPEDLEPKINQFLNFILYRRIQYDYPLALMGNMDEVPLAFNMPSN